MDETIGTGEVACAATLEPQGDDPLATSDAPALSAELPGPSCFIPTDE